MVRTPAEGGLSGQFFHIQFRAPKSTDKYYRENWHFYSQDSQPFPITEEQSKCWQEFGSYGFYELANARKRLKQIRTHEKNHDKRGWTFRIARVQFVLYTNGA